MISWKLVHFEHKLFYVKTDVWIGMKWIQILSHHSHIICYKGTWQFETFLKEVEKAWWNINKGELIPDSSFLAGCVTAEEEIGWIHKEYCHYISCSIGCIKKEFILNEKPAIVTEWENSIKQQLKPKQK